MTQSAYPKRGVAAWPVEFKLLCQATECDPFLEMSAIAGDLGVSFKTDPRGDAYLGRDECLRLAVWLIQRAREMEKKA
jgi:hypothetical protein